MKRHSFSNNAGFTVAEMLVSLGCVAVVGSMVFEFLNAGTLLTAKNYSINGGHEETRKGVNRLLRDIHASVSVPFLVDSNYNAVTSQPVDSNGKPTGTPGVCFQLVSLGPNWVWQDPVSATLIIIFDNGNVPTPGQRLVVPYFGVEEDITRAVASGTSGHSNVFLQCGDETNILSKQNSNGQANAKAAPQYVDNSHRNSNTAYAITYYTDKIIYIVENAKLNLYKQRYTGGTFQWIYQATVARNITSSTPFSTPLDSSGTANNRYVHVDISVLEPKYSNRGYQATGSLVDASIPYRSALCTYQGINHCN